eukprot:1243565-Rhodomonas_salina.2
MISPYAIALRYRPTISPYATCHAISMHYGHPLSPYPYAHAPCLHYISTISSYALCHAPYCIAVAVYAHGTECAVLRACMGLPGPRVVHSRPHRGWAGPTLSAYARPARCPCSAVREGVSAYGSARRSAVLRQRRVLGARAMQRSAVLCYVVLCMVLLCHAVLTPRMVLLCCGTDIAYGATGELVAQVRSPSRYLPTRVLRSVRVWYYARAMHMVLRACYAVSGTELAYGGQVRSVERHGRRVTCANAGDSVTVLVYSFPNPFRQSSVQIYSFPLPSSHASHSVIWSRSVYALVVVGLGSSALFNRGGSRGRSTWSEKEWARDARWRSRGQSSSSLESVLLYPILPYYSTLPSYAI